MVSEKCQVHRTLRNMTKYRVELPKLFEPVPANFGLGFVFVFSNKILSILSISSFDGPSALFSASSCGLTTQDPCVALYIFKP